MSWECKGKDGQKPQKNSTARKEKSKEEWNAVARTEEMVALTPSNKGGRNEDGNGSQRASLSISECSQGQLPLF